MTTFTLQSWSIAAAVVTGQKGDFFVCVQDAQQACILLYKPAGKEAKIVVLMTAEVKRPKES